MVENEEHTFARESSASFLTDAGVGILWTAMGKHLRLDILASKSWDEASPHLERRIVEHVLSLYRDQVVANEGQGHLDRRTKQALANLRKRLFYYPWERNVTELAIAAAGAPTNSCSSCSQCLRYSCSQQHVDPA